MLKRFTFAFLLLLTSLVSQSSTFTVTIYTANGLTVNYSDATSSDSVTFAGGTVFATDSTPSPLGFLYTPGTLLVDLHGPNTRITLETFSNTILATTTKFDWFGSLRLAIQNSATFNPITYSVTGDVSINFSTWYQSNVPGLTFNSMTNRFFTPGSFGTTGTPAVIATNNINTTLAVFTPNITMPNYPNTVEMANYTEYGTVSVGTPLDNNLSFFLSDTTPSISAVGIHYLTIGFGFTSDPTVSTGFSYPSIQFLTGPQAGCSNTFVLNNNAAQGVGVANSSTVNVNAIPLLLVGTGLFSPPVSIGSPCLISVNPDIASIVMSPSGGYSAYTILGVPPQAALFYLQTVNFDTVNAANSQTSEVVRIY